jgi:hypothetical protein
MKNFKIGPNGEVKIDYNQTEPDKKLPMMMMCIPDDGTEFKEIVPKEGGLN